MTGDRHSGRGTRETTESRRQYNSKLRKYDFLLLVLSFVVLSVKLSESL